MNENEREHCRQKRSSDAPAAHILAACRYSCAGFMTAFRDETAFRLVLMEALFCIPLALVLGSDFAQKILLLLPSVLSIIVELLNSGLENAVDRVSLDLHPLAKKAKDLGSAAQMSSQIFLAGTWLTWFLCG